MSYGKLRRYLTGVVGGTEGEEGQALAEYTLVLAFIFMAAVLALTAIGVAVSGVYESFAGMIGG